jgi:hypothetical protein
MTIGIPDSHPQDSAGAIIVHTGEGCMLDIDDGVLHTRGSASRAGAALSRLTQRGEISGG